MFNVKNKIYVAHEGELIDLMYERSIVLHTRYVGLNTFDGMTEDKTMKGNIGSFANYSDMIRLAFEGDMDKFHDFLNAEDDLLIIAGKVDYARLYSEMQLELGNDFGISDENLTTMRELQRLKDFFHGDLDMRKYCYAQNSNDSSFDRVFNNAKAEYIPSGTLFRNLNHLPFETIYAMYKWGNISKIQANNKIGSIAGSMLAGQVQNLIDQAKIAVTTAPEIFKEFMADPSITSVDDIIKAIFTNPLLTKLFCNEVYTVEDVDLPDVKRLCSIIIAKDFDFDSQPEVDQQELDFFFDLYEQKDIDVIETAKFNFLSTGMVASRQAKFNTGLIMTT